MLYINPFEPDGISHFYQYVDQSMLVLRVFHFYSIVHLGSNWTPSEAKN